MWKHLICTIVSSFYVRVVKLFLFTFFGLTQRTKSQDFACFTLPRPCMVSLKSSEDGVKKSMLFEASCEVSIAFHTMDSRSKFIDFSRQALLFSAKRTKP